MSFFQSMAEDFGLYYLGTNKNYVYVPFQQEIIVPILHKVEKGELTQVILFTPPRHGKTDLMTVNFVSWFMGRHPNLNSLVVSYSSELARDFGGKIRNKIASELHQKIFPKCKLSADSRAKDVFSLTEGGRVFAVGFDGTMTGRGAHLIVIDDPIKNSQSALSEADENFRRSTFESSIWTRQEKGCRIIVPMTRWMGDSFTGWLLERDGAVYLDKPYLDLLKAA